jgi:AcrR family transcriptional regulator
MSRPQRGRLVALVLGPPKTGSSTTHIGSFVTAATRAPMEAIAAKAGVATQTVYYFFRTKALLLQQVVEVAAAVQAQPIPVMDPSMPESPWVRVHETLGAEATAAPPAAGGVRPHIPARAIGQGSRPAHAGAESPSIR